MVPLHGSNYPTWKIQCRMALTKDGLWNIVNGTETAPGQSQAEKYAKFMSRRDHAVAAIVLSLIPHCCIYSSGQNKVPITYRLVSD